jgi:hypothetical protein
MKAMKIFFALVLAVILGILMGLATAELRIAQNPWHGNPQVQM